MRRDLLSALLVVLLAGCSGSDVPTALDPPAASASTTVPASSKPSPTVPAAAPSSPPSVATPTSTGPVETVDVDGLANFRSPTGNIACILDEAAARCDVRTMRSTPPAKPADCDLDWGEALGVGSGNATFLCHGDTTFGTTETLEYDMALRAGFLVCTSRRSGMTCQNTRTRHGFALSRDAYRLY